MAAAVLPQARRSRRSGRRAGSVYAAMTVLMVAALLPALHPPRPPVPPTAAYAPEAVATPPPPPEQSSVSGKTGNAQGGKGAPGGGGATPTPSPTATPAAGPTPPVPNTKDQGTVVPKHLDCVGDPATQIPDTQSAPCISSWDGSGGNGGRTASGVTADTIRVWSPHPQGKEPQWVQYLNDHFELYGRKIVIVGGGCPGEDAEVQSGGPVAAMTAEATKVASKDVFASLGACDSGGGEIAYYDTLARKGVMSVSQTPDTRTSADFARYAPYEWSYIPPLDQDEQAMAATACRQMLGSAPVYAGTGKRVFGIARTAFPDQQPIDLTPLINGLSACGITVDPKDIRTVDFVEGTQASGYQNQNAQSVQESQQAMTQMKLDGVTSVLVVTQAATTETLMLAADQLGMTPEWLMSTYLYNVEWSLNPNPPSDQWSHAFGLDYINKLVPPQDNTWYSADEEIEPGYQWGTKNGPGEYYQGKYEWYELLLLANGLQMAGPHLTPQTFQEGLWKTQWPNPPSPYYEGHVGFAQDHGFVKDYALEWYSPSATGAWGQGGSWCYVNHGTRYTDDSQPRNAPFFQGTCDS